jgi:uncharacterized repeat protein (TIGR04138 family)
MQTASFEEVVEAIVQGDRRYAREAYHFVREALDYTQRIVHKEERQKSERHDWHVTGQQLLAGIREHALHLYGPMALFLLHEWGVRRCEDFGEIVFNLVEQGKGMFGKTDQDSRDDFKGGYEFGEAFRRPYQPSRRRRPPAAQAAPQPADS